MLHASSSLFKHQGNHRAPSKPIGCLMIKADDCTTWIALCIDQKDVSGIQGNIPIVGSSFRRRIDRGHTHGESSRHACAAGRHERCSWCCWCLAIEECGSGKLHISSDGEVKVWRILVVESSHSDKLPLSTSGMRCARDDATAFISHGCADRSWYAATGIHAKGYKVMSWRFRCNVCHQFERSAIVQIVDIDDIMIRKEHLITILQDGNVGIRSHK
mmetsp:Transcript_7077/g.11812  ORF Transcript_7077/g.11812 Transcript_7077/m.11812 type:complete len:216 (+) Transcript_7077:160-807(+)